MRCGPCRAAPGAIGVNAAAGGAIDGSGPVTVGARWKAGLTVGGAFCARPGGTAAFGAPGATVGAGAPAGGVPTAGGAPGGDPGGRLKVEPAPGGVPGAAPGGIRPGG
jgi:hypothetical protein